MTKEDRIVKKKRKKRFRLALIIIVFVYILLRFMPTLYASNTNTYTVESGIIEVSENVKGIIIKEEKVYRSKGKGTLTFLKKEGDKVGIGTRIAQMSVGSDSSNLNKELEAIERELDNAGNNDNIKDVYSSDIKKNQNEINNIVLNIQDNVQSSNYEIISELKSELIQKMDKQESILGENSFSAATLDNLVQRKQEIVKQIENSNIFYTSNNGGILSYKTDGLEEMYSINNVLDFYPKDYKEINENTREIKSGDELQVEEPVFKIIDNYDWYLMVKLQNSKSIDSLIEGKDVYIKFNDADLKIKARIVKINRDKNESIVIFRFNSHLHEFYNKRYVDIEIVYETYEGLKILNDSIIEKDGIKGVYLKGISGIVGFRPIIIKVSEDEYSVIDEGDSNRNINLTINGETVTKRTVVLFDEIFENGSSVREGQIIN